MTAAQEPRLTTVDGGGDEVRPESRLSILGHMKERREEIKQGATTVLKVERWTDPEVFVRFKPVDHNLIRAGMRRVEKAQEKDKAKVEVEANCDVLIHGCVGVFARLDGGTQEYSLRPNDYEGDLTRFDADLADNLGLPENSTARAVVKALYIFDGDIMSTAAKVAEFSGYQEKEADEGVLGE